MRLDLDSFLGVFSDNAEAANALPIEAHILGIGLAAAKGMAIVHEDVDGLSISLTVPAGKALQQAMPHLSWGAYGGLLSGAGLQGQLAVAVAGGCYWGLYLKADVGACSWGLLLEAQLGTDSRLAAMCKEGCMSCSWTTGWLGFTEVFMHKALDTSAPATH